MAPPEKDERSEFRKKFEIKAIEFLDGFGGLLNAIIRSFNSENNIVDEPDRPLPEDLQRTLTDSEERRERHEDEIKPEDLEQAYRIYHEVTGNKYGPPDIESFKAAKAQRDAEIAAVKARNQEKIDAKKREKAEKRRAEREEASRQREAFKELNKSEKDAVKLTYNGTVKTRKKVTGSAKVQSAAFPVLMQYKNPKTGKITLKRVTTSTTTDVSNLATLRLIAQAETRNNYNILGGMTRMDDLESKYGIRGYTGRQLTNMTIDEVIDLQEKIDKVQAARAKKNPNTIRTTHAGAYQIGLTTLKGMKKRLKLSGKELFDQNMQNKLGYALMVGRGWKEYLASARTEADLKKYVDGIKKESGYIEGGLKYEWSVLKGSDGRGAYDGYNGNNAGVSYGELLRAIEQDVRFFDTGMVYSPGSIQNAVAYPEMNSRYYLRSITTPKRGKATRPHLGNDFRKPVGTPYYAVDSGTVTNIEMYSKTAGRYQVIDHGDYIARYLHSHKISTSVGDQVDQGQQIGLVGNTGDVTGPHLHLDIVVRGKHPKTGVMTWFYVDPQLAMAQGDKISTQAAKDALVAHAYKTFGNRALYTYYDGEVGAFYRSRGLSDAGPTKQPIIPAEIPLGPDFEAAASEQLALNSPHGHDHDDEGAPTTRKEEFAANTENMVKSSQMADLGKKDIKTNKTMQVETHTG